MSELSTMSWQNWVATCIAAWTAGTYVRLFPLQWGMDAAVAPAVSRLGDATIAFILLTRYGWGELWSQATGSQTSAYTAAYFGGMLMFGGVFTWCVGISAWLPLLRFSQK